MTCIVTDRCINCRYGECIAVCPVNAFRVGPNFVVIDPRACINCTTCIVFCPVGAIAADYDLHTDERYLIAENARLARVFEAAAGPVKPLDNADDWSMEQNKFKLLQEP